MAAKSSKKTSKNAKATPPPSEEFDVDEDDFEAGDSDPDVEISDAAAPDPAAAHRRDWRDVERYREKRELRKLVGDDVDDLDADLDELDDPGDLETDNKHDAKRPKARH